MKEEEKKKYREIVENREKMKNDYVKDKQKKCANSEVGEKGFKKKKEHEKQSEINSER